MGYDSEPVRLHLEGRGLYGELVVEFFFGYDFSQPPIGVIGTTRPLPGGRLNLWIVLGIAVVVYLFFLILAICKNSKAKKNNQLKNYQ